MEFDFITLIPPLLFALGDDGTHFNFFHLLNVRLQPQLQNLTPYGLEMLWMCYAQPDEGSFRHPHKGLASDVMLNEKMGIQLKIFTTVPLEPLLNICRSPKITRLRTSQFTLWFCSLRCIHSQCHCHGLLFWISVLTILSALITHGLFSVAMLQIRVLRCR